MTRARALLGCIADDFTGATDLANNLVRAGMRVVQAMGVPTTSLDTEADAIVVALKSRTIPKGDAIAQSLAALQWLKAQGAEQIYFKYCSTFDSTPTWQGGCLWCCGHLDPQDLLGRLPPGSLFVPCGGLASPGLLPLRVFPSGVGLWSWRVYLRAIPVFRSQRASPWWGGPPGWAEDSGRGPQLRRRQHLGTLGASPSSDGYRWREENLERDCESLRDASSGRGGARRATPGEQVVDERGVDLRIPRKPPAAHPLAGLRPDERTQDVSRLHLHPCPLGPSGPSHEFLLS